MYKIFMIVGIAVVVFGWICYGIYNFIMDRREKKQPQQSQQLQQAHDSMSEYAKKMSGFKKKRYEQDR